MRLLYSKIKGMSPAANYLALDFAYSCEKTSFYRDVEIYFLFKLRKMSSMSWSFISSDESASTE